MTAEALETLATGAPRTLASLKPGDRLRSNDHKSRKKQTVVAVNLSHDGETIQVVTDMNTFHFTPGERVSFPRRPSGAKVVHRYDHNPAMDEVFVGDVIPPKDGWDEGPTAWRSGLQVTDIQISQRYLGWIVSVKPLDGTAGHKQFVSRRSPYFYGDFWTDNLDELVEANGKTPKKTASGRYQHLDGRIARFAIVNRPGRKPTDAEILATPEDFTPWVLLDSGQAHPSDKRFN